MRKAFAALAALALLAFAPLAKASPYKALPADLAVAVEAYDQAQLKGDRAELERLVAPDYVLIGGNSDRQTKADLIRDYVDPGFKLDPFTIREPVEIVWTDGAVLGGLVDFAGTSGGQRFSILFRFADVWAKRDGVWRVAYTQVTRVPPKPRA